MGVRSEIRCRADERRVWLIFFDLHLRRFLRRDAENRHKETELFREADLQVVSDHLWNNRIALAASLSRLRIKSSALGLKDLLPLHLQDEKVSLAAASPIVTGWVNPYKLKTKLEAIESLNLHGFIESIETEEGEVPLKTSNFKWDKLCPLFMSCIPSNLSLFARSNFMKDNQFIMQDRAFTLGPAIFSRLLDHFEIEGDVIQTHMSSPRSVAYLAALFQTNCRVNEIIIFGAGMRLHEYNEYMNKLGIQNLQIRAESFRDSVRSMQFEKVVGIFITPPNSYSGIKDPIDLICSRGGDLSMLEVLTESEISESGKERVAEILAEQRESLRLAMSKPHVQFILYETHSMVETENEVMVNVAVESVNRSACDRHINVYKEKKVENSPEGNPPNFEQVETPSNFKKKMKLPKEMKTSTESSPPFDDSDSEGEGINISNLNWTSNLNTNISDLEYDEIKIPKSDVFEIVEIPDMCLYRNKCFHEKSAGCFLSLIKRKQLTRLDEKHLISMAEKRGLFGDTSPKKEKCRLQCKSMKNEEKIISQPNDVRHGKNEEISQLIERLLRPTMSSLGHSYFARKLVSEFQIIKSDYNICQHHKNQLHLAEIKRMHSTYISSIHSRSGLIKYWWLETLKFLRRNWSQIDSLDTFVDIINESKLKPLTLTRFQNVDNELRRIAYPISRININFQT